MIRILFSITLLFSILNSQAQAIYKYSYYCVYDFKFQYDSTDTKSIEKDKMLLFINEKESLFVSYNKFIYDSLSYLTYIKTGSIYRGSYAMEYKTRYPFKIFKKGENIETIDKAGRSEFVYNEKKKDLRWSLKNEIAIINGFKCQKATVFFGNRFWTAWFDSNVPIQEGPYKFCGLPGIIVKLEDAQNFFVFELKTIISGSFNYSNIPNSKSLTQISKAKFFELSKNYNENQYEMDQASGIVFTSGQEEIRKRIGKLAKRNNNFLELF